MNNYYDEIYLKIEKLYEDKEYLKAEMLIEDELNMPYIPMDFEEKLLSLKKKYHPSNMNADFKLNDEEIEMYLKADDYKQLVAVNYLDGLNLRDYHDLISSYLISDGIKEAKTLLLSSMINQDLSDEFKIVKDGLEITFIPRYVESPEISDGFISGDAYLKNIFENDNPSLYALAKDLLIKECFLYLPLSYDEYEGELIAKRIIIYLYECLDDDKAKQEFIDNYLSDNEKLIIEDKVK